MADLEVIPAERRPAKDTDILFRPDDLEELVKGPMREIVGVMTRQLYSIEDGQADAPPIDGDPAINLIGKLVAGFNDGSSLSRLQESVKRLTAAQEDRVTLVQSLIAANSISRLHMWMSTRDRLERFIADCAARGDLTASEALVMAKMAQTELAAITESLKPVPIKDANSILKRSDFTTEAVETAKSSRFNRTTPIGREIIRRAIFKMTKVTQETQEGVELTITDAGKEPPCLPAT